MFFLTVDNELATNGIDLMKNKFILWISVLRLWAITASTIPVMVGAALAYHDGCFQPVCFLLALLCGWLIHITANLLNTYGDFLQGVDTMESPSAAPHLVYGTLTPAQVFRAAMLTLALSVVLSLTLLYMSHWRLLYFALPGFAGALGYTTGPRYKHAGWGTPAVGILMGVLMTNASYFVHSQTITPESLILSLPVAALVSAILLGNDIRDMPSDQKACTLSFALITGMRRAQHIFILLHIIPYVVLVPAIITGILPAVAWSILLALPLSIKAIYQCSTSYKQVRPESLEALDRLSASAHLTLGFLVSISLLFQ